MFKALKDPSKSQYCYQIDTMDKSVTEKILIKVTKHPKKLDKAYKIHPEPINTKNIDFVASKHHVLLHPITVKDGCQGLRNWGRDVLSHCHPNSLRTIKNGTNRSLCWDGQLKISKAKLARTRIKCQVDDVKSSSSCEAIHACFLLSLL